MIDRTSDLQVLAATIYGEARGEPLEGKRAVACVILNRVARSHNRPQFGNGTVASACLAPYQLSCWNVSDPNFHILVSLNFDKPPDDLFFCIEVAQDALAGRLTDPTGGACFYKVTELPWPHDWGAEVPPTITIGHHSFYDLP